ncbi:MAG: carboxylesterase/lipase family protein [Mycobacteriaceae bacterium]|nr:carboxylesterase/lipase family protein [Mycobacteriaceae bacterium]NBQ41867.1 carboxylesterase/lipase family protein [Mycobacteriaceae bacterium]
MKRHTVRVATSDGVVEGFAQNGVNRWRSIPYARPPVGPLRFRAPQPPQPWSGVRSCHDFGSCAPQQRRYTMTGLGRFQPMSEDCLTLNVVTPRWSGAEPDPGPLPVMFFIHGGGYILGSSATPIYDGAALARRGCVYVSANYRLGVLGALDLSSLSTPETPIEGNLFLRDLVMALRWVRENIGAFGGDPDNVTIFGESAGAHAVATLLAVPDAGGLFARAISESPASGLISTPETATEIAGHYVDLLGVSPNRAAETIMKATPAELGKTLDRLLAQGMERMAGAFAVGPTLGDDVLPTDPLHAMKTGQAHSVPLIVGTNAHEGRLFTRILKLLPTTEAAIEQVLSRAEPGARDRITGAYPSYPHPRACVQLGGDFAFGSAAWQIAESHGRHAPTYVYRYDYAPRTFHWAGLGATHATELLAVFDLYRTPWGSALTVGVDRRSALRVSHHVGSRWHNFSRTGVPSTDWPAYTTDQRAVMVFDHYTRVEYDPHPHRRKAWEGFGLGAHQPAGAD